MQKHPRSLAQLEEIFQKNDGKGTLHTCMCAVQSQVDFIKPFTTKKMTNTFLDHSCSVLFVHSIKGIQFSHQIDSQLSLYEYCRNDAHYIQESLKSKTHPLSMSEVHEALLKMEDI